MSKHVIDPLQMEADGKLPHWLDPRERNKGKFDTIRAKHIARHKEQRAAKRRSDAASLNSKGDTT